MMGKTSFLTRKWMIDELDVSNEQWDDLGK